jgi:hypothetical protein
MSTFQGLYNWSIILDLPQTLDEAGKTFQAYNEDW